MTPPSAEELIPRLFLGPALRSQPDRRLVRLVRDGYEAAFDEIVRRYGGQLRRFAGAIVGSRAEDVTQDSFSKALLALRRDESEIDLRPWLYRIVRNTALNDLRDRPPSAVALANETEGNGGVAEEVERREEIAELIGRLRALPEPQRAAIVMRELEGLGHEEIAAALGISDGAARQAIHRARTALRNGLGLALPLPLLRAMLEGGAALPSAEIAAGGAGAGIGLKAATATVLVAGTFGAGVALHEADRADRLPRGADEAAAAPRHDAKPAQATPPASTKATDGGKGESHGGSPGGGRGNDESEGSGGSDRSSGASRGPSRHGGENGESGHRGPGPGPSEGESGHSSGPSSSDPSGPGGGSPGAPESGGDSSGPGGGGSPSGGEGPGGGAEPGGHSGPGPSSGGGSDDLVGGGGGSGSNSGPGSGSGGEASGSGSGGSRDSRDGDGFSQQMEPQPQEDR